FVFGDRKEQDILVETDVAFWLVAWDLEGNKERAHVKLAGSYPRSDRTSVSFEANQQGQRAALLLTGGVVHVAFAMRPPETDVRYHGWVLSYYFNPITSAFEPRGA